MTNEELRNNNAWNSTCGIFEVQHFCLDLAVIASVAVRVSATSSHAAPLLLMMQKAGLNPFDVFDGGRCCHELHLYLFWGQAKVSSPKVAESHPLLSQVPAGWATRWRRAQLGVPWGSASLPLVPPLTPERQNKLWESFSSSQASIELQGPKEATQVLFVCSDTSRRSHAHTERAKSSLHVAQPCTYAVWVFLTHARVDDDKLNRPIF